MSPSPPCCSNLRSSRALDPKLGLHLRDRVSDAFTVDTIPNLTCITLEGEVDTATAPDLEMAIQAGFAEGVSMLLLDLGPTDDMSSMEFPDVA